MLKTYITVAVAAYLLGSIPFGYILVRLFLQHDIRTTGSGNIGATNVARSGAKWLAIATLLLDAGKGYAAVMLASSVFVRQALDAENERAEDLVVVAAASALFAVVGHCFPVWLKFRGGKGVATALGVFAALAPKAILISLGIFIALMIVTRYVSLGSVCAAAALPLATYWLYPDLRAPVPLLLVIAVSVIVIAKHHQNIGRLISGTEHRWGEDAA